ncbi:MAG: LysM peptidoglycan-binding domain-containing protein [Candidatus Promineifilaceae bacterium]
MKRRLSLRHWILSLAILLVLGLVACERPLQEEIEEATDGDDPSVVVPNGNPVDAYKRSLPPLVTDSAAPDAYPGPEVDAEVMVVEPVEEVPVAPEPAEPLVYEVQSGDTLVNIALQYNVTIEDIAAASGLANVDVLDIGQRLVIPVDGMITAESPAEAADTAPAEESVAEEAAAEEPNDQIHIVQFGDNLFRIGLIYGCKHEELATYNSLANPDSLEVGQEIRIPTCE